MTVSVSTRMSLHVDANVEPERCQSFKCQNYVSVALFGPNCCERIYRPRPCCWKVRREKRDSAQYQPNNCKPRDARNVKRITTGVSHGNFICF